MLIIGMVLLLAAIGALSVWGMADVLDGKWDGKQPEW